jgi:hypothetical protein
MFGWVSVYLHAAAREPLVPTVGGGGVDIKAIHYMVEKKLLLLKI